MYFDFEDGHPDLERVPSAFTPREGAMASVIVHLSALLLIVLLPKLPYFQRLAAERAAAQAKLAEIQKQPPTRFVFVQPRVEFTPKRPPPANAPLADLDRNAMTLKRPPNPTNPQPFNRGNSPEFVEKSPPPQPQRMQQQPGPQTPPSPDPSGQSAANTGNDALRLPNAMVDPPAAHQGGSSGRPNTGPLSEALRNLSRYAEQAAFENPNGGQNSNFGPSIQFDTKGVDFGKWIRKFKAQVYRNWNVPQAAMSLHGHVVITFNVHKNGALTDVSVMQPSSVDSFTTAAAYSLLASNPTEPLPPDYPSEKCFFTVTFYYNERLPEGP
jgi:outer membrane biosynthesis protein TonB